MKSRDGSGRTRGFRFPGARRLLAAGLCGLFAAAVLFAALCFLFPFQLNRFDSYPASSWVTASDGSWLRAYRSDDDEFRFVSRLDEISDWLELATIAVEDQDFRSHHGVDIPAVFRAAWQNLVRMRIHSGASTLTMQLVRILDQRPRTIASKIVEAFYALQIDARLDKDAILAAYLNLAPYGGNLRGVEAAARRYLGKSAADLSLGEAALIAGLPQSPSRLRPDRYYDRALARRQLVLAAMLRQGMIDQGRFEDASRSRPAVRP
ncbi:MAG: transglycosylase domain-containing protein, partial [Planctomycetota bacterium]|nr:transglycosylase domain-containing protein [Planctomycetota bacterium]